MKPLTTHGTNRNDDGPCYYIRLLRLLHLLCLRTDTRPRSQATGGSDTLQRVVGVSAASAQPDRRRRRRVTGDCNPALAQSRRIGVSERASVSTALFLAVSLR